MSDDPARISITIDVDMDRRCDSCRKPGATQCGLCLPCVTKKMLGKLPEKRKKARA